MVRADDPSKLYAFFTETLRLPVAWPLATRGGVTSGGAGFGNANVEVVAVCDVVKERRDNATGMVEKKYADRIKSGDYKVLYSIDAGLSGTAKAETAAGTAPGGSFAVKIVTPPPNTIVTDSGEVVEVPAEKKQSQR